MSTVPYEHQKLYRQIILLLREAGLTPREPSITYDFYGLSTHIQKCTSKLFVLYSI